MSENKIKTKEGIAFGNRLRLARKEKGLNQVSLANACGLTQSVISKIERGEQESSGYTLLIASELRVNPLWLAYGKGEMDDNQSISFNTFMTECYVFTIEQCKGYNATFRQITTIAESLYNSGKKHGKLKSEIYEPLLDLIKNS